MRSRAAPPLELHANAGPPRVVGIRADTRVELDIVAREGSTEDLELHFAAPSETSPSAPAEPARGPERPPATASNPWRTAAWTALGVSAASLATSSVTYYLGHREYTALQKDGVCQNELCQASGDLSTYNALRITHLATLLAGALLGAAGLSVLWLDPAAEPSSTVATQIPPTLTLDTNGMLLTGRF